MEIILQFAAGNLDRIVQNIKYPAISQFQQCCAIPLNENVKTTLQWMFLYMKVKWRDKVVEIWLKGSNNRIKQEC